jgi:nitrous oxide reductase accessory protein NosL
MERVTVKTVRETFVSFVDIARRVGFDTTGWVLQEGNAWRAYRLFVQDLPRYTYSNHPMADCIGTNAREAYYWLSASIKTMGAIIQLRSEK